MSRAIRAVINHFMGQRVSTSSLQFRLTLELIVLSALGLGGVAVWAGWQMERNLVTAHKQTLEYIAMHFPEQVAFYSETGSLLTGLEHSIRKVSTPGLVVWVKSPEGKLLAQSRDDSNPSAEVRNVNALPSVPQKPQVFHFGDRYVVLWVTQSL